MDSKTPETRSLGNGKPGRILRNLSHSSSVSSLVNASEHLDQMRPLETGRFTVTKVIDPMARKGMLSETVSECGSLIVPVSIFDEPTKDAKGRKKDQDRISLDDFKVHYKEVIPTAALTLYEDEAGNVDSIQGIVKKTVGSPDEDEEHAKKANLTTFFGVFLPCCQNIVGVIYFVRVPWIVGCGGILEAALIVGICNMMSVCTAISMSAIATNGRVTAGGTYFMISRSLGPTFGGSVGILFFIGTSISVAMYYLGTTEVLLTYIAPGLAVFGKDSSDPQRLNDYRLFGSILLSMMGVVVFIGVRCVSRFALYLILFLVAAILSVLTGIAVSSISPNEELKVCALGDRLIKYSVAHMNGSWQCHKDANGSIYKAYCKQVNGTDVCDEYFLDHDTKLLHGVPGLSLKLAKEALYNSYTERGDIPGTLVKANPSRELVTDITTSFVVLFSIYFPSITGVESGSNYSGDLRDAQVSIPRGTMSAVAVTSTLYLTSVFFMGSSVEGMLLRDKYGGSVSESGDLVLSLMAWPTKWVVLIGSLTATIGAGLQALAGGPRLLQAIAEDNIIPHLNFFAKKWRGEPVRGLCVTFCIAEIGILIAFLDYVAPIVTMFFLMCYGFINFAVTLQSLLDTPHWRPSFKCYHWSLTLFGTSLCLTSMFICSWQYALIAITMAFILYQYIEYKGAEKEWGDGMTGLSMSAAMYALSRLKQDFKHTKNWRPQILVLLKMVSTFEGQTEFSPEDMPLVMLADMMKEGKGLNIFATIIKGQLGEYVKEQQKLKQINMTHCTNPVGGPQLTHIFFSSDNNCFYVTMLKIVFNCLEHSGIKGFIEIVVSPSVIDGLSCLIQSAGLGALRPNTIIMGWPRDWVNHKNVMSYRVFLETMRSVALTRNALIVLKAQDFPTRAMRMTGTIDIWWIINDGGMLLLLGHLLRRSKTWARCTLRLFTVAQEQDNTVQIKKDLQVYLYQLRIEGTVEVVEMSEVEMSAYVYERTLKLEERTRMLNNIGKKDRRMSTINAQKKLLDKEVQYILDNARSAFNVLSKKPMIDGSSPIDVANKDVLMPTQENIRNMNTAVRLNTLLKQKSIDASLVILNLPVVPESSKGQVTYMSFLEELTDGVDRLLLVRGTGSEVITVYN